MRGKYFLVGAAICAIGLIVGAVFLLPRPGEELTTTLNDVASASSPLQNFDDSTDYSGWTKKLLGDLGNCEETPEGCLEASIRPNTADLYPKPGKTRGIHLSPKPSVQQPQASQSETATPPKSKELGRMQLAGGQVASLPEGQVATDAPTAMTIGEPKEVNATVGIGVTAEQLKANEKPGDQHVEGQAKISYEMTADLTGPGFKIERMNAEKQIVVYGVPTVWSWKVEGTQEGEQDLTAILYDIVPGLGQNPKVRISSYVQHIKVAVRPQPLGERINAALKYVTDGAHALYAAIAAILAVLAIFNKRIRALLRDLKPSEKEDEPNAEKASKGHSAEGGDAERDTPC